MRRQAGHKARRLVIIVSHLAISAGLVTTSHRIATAPARARRATLQQVAPLVLGDPSFAGLPAALAAVRALRPPEETQQKALKSCAPFKVSGASTDEPTFTRLFTHEAWRRYTGRTPLLRWWRTTVTWGDSTIVRAVLPISAIASLYAYCIARLPGVLLPRTSPVPMSLIGTAIGLLLVFRTNNSYQRLSEARTLWGHLITYTRQIAVGAATALAFDGNVPARAEARDGAARICRYLAAFAWELSAKLTAPIVDDDLLVALLPPQEAAFLAAERSRPLQLLAALRRELHRQFRLGNLPTHLHRKLEEDVRELDLIVGNCERLFSSPLPPTMSRHIVRCLLLWLVGFPFVLAGTMAPWYIAVWVFTTSYIFVGIDEVGVQVEQPFEIVPTARIASLVIDNLEEAFVAPPRVLADAAAV